MRFPTSKRLVVERVKIAADSVVVTREVFPTNNPHAKVLSLVELKIFGTIAEATKICVRRSYKKSDVAPAT